METFAPTQAPNTGLEHDTEPRLLTAPFGDGYKQRVPFGLNHMPRVWNLSWNPVSPTVANYIETFFRARNGNEPFLYVHPRTNETLQIVCLRWRRANTQWNFDSITATFEEDFSWGGV